MRDDSLGTGIGVLKAMLGTYILIIVTIFGYQAKHDNVEENQIAIEAEAQEDYVVVSCNGKTLAIDAKSYDEYMNSDASQTLVIDTQDQNATQVVINKEDLQELKRCTSYEEASEYISELNSSNTFRR